MRRESEKNRKNNIIIWREQMKIFERVDFSPEWNQLCPEWWMDPDAPDPVNYWKFSANHHDVPCGETAIVTAKLFRGDCIVSDVEAELTIEADFHKTEKRKIRTAKAGIQIPVTLEKPGFVRISLNDGETVGAYGIGFSIQDIQPAKEVENFDSYWKKQLQRLAECPADVLECSPVSFPNYPGTETFKVRVNCVDGIPVSGLLSKPSNARPKSLPGYLFMHGAGVRPPFPPLPWARHGFLAFNISALGLRYGEGEVYEESERKRWENYAQIRSADPEKIPFNSMALRVVRALEYLKSRPEWNGKVLIVHGGSQGGWQSLVAAGLDPDVTFAMVEAPANCNLLGALEGRKPSWPGTIRVEEGYSGENLAAALFDGVAFGRRAKAPAVFTVGYSDCAAVPSSVCAACRVYGGPAILRAFPDLGHEQAVFWSGEKIILEAAGLKDRANRDF